MPLGNFGEINTTCVLPSSRGSDRVPFGTGRAVQSILESEQEWLTYPLKAFYPLRALFARIIAGTFQGLGDVEDDNLKAYLEQQNFSEVFQEIRYNTSSTAAFTKRFFRWFDAFRMMKYLHYCLEKGMKKTSVLELGRWYWETVLEKEWTQSGNAAESELLLCLALRELN